MHVNGSVVQGIVLRLCPQVEQKDYETQFSKMLQHSRDIFKGLSADLKVKLFKCLFYVGFLIYCDCLSYEQKRRKKA